MRGPVALAISIVVVTLLGYPLVTIAGGWPQFPTRGECARAAQSDDDEVDVVYGRFDDLVAAENLLSRVVSFGFVGTEIGPDGCGLWKVYYDSIESLDQGHALAEEARSVGLDPRVESEG